MRVHQSQLLVAEGVRRRADDLHAAIGPGFDGGGVGRHHEIELHDGKAELSGDPE